MNQSNPKPATQGAVRQRSRAALLILDIITDYRFEDAAALLQRLPPVAERIAALKQRLHRARIPAIYVNDNLGLWRSDSAGQVHQCMRAGQPGADIVKRLAPTEHDYFIFKARHSGFFGTALETVLAYIGARRLVITGVSSHQCVLFTANDAYVRDFELMIPRDCITAPSASAQRFALRYFEEVLGADTRPAAALRLDSLRGPRRRART